MGLFLRIQKCVNPCVLPCAKRVWPYGVLEHTGRRSGRAYRSPVVAFTLGDDAIIPLPFSAAVDWCRNTLAAGRCTLRQRGSVLQLGSPELVDRTTALPAFPAPVRAAIRLIGPRQFLRLRRQAT